jgi:dipeptidyl aminopeptidase/acylaminoacyl peptidase
VLLYLHGGPALRFAQGFSVYPPAPPQATRYPIHVLAGQGYAIFCPNPRGSDGYGEKFRQANVKDWGGADFQDIMSGLDTLVDRGLADPDRLGVMGWSYGGYMTAWTITQTNRFKAASAGAGVMDLFSFYGQTDIPSFLERYWGGLPWRERERYTKHSPMTFVGNVKTPTLIQHGEKDDRVPLAQSQELYAALKRQKVPVELVIYPRQGHNPTEPRLQREVLQRNVDWFNRWLKK